jgi:hypothetical protein
MAYSNADKQQRYRLRARGLVHVQGWVTPKQAEAIRRILAERGGEAPPTARGCGVTPRAERNHPYSP